MIREQTRLYFRAIKYWLQGDAWWEAVEYSTALQKGFKKPEVEA